MRVSIITPTYNRADLLPETIDSILGQNYPDLEYIVLDDGSADDTQSVLERYSDKIRVIRHDNMGETVTVNKGFSLATGDIICVVSSDDPLLPGSIQHVVDAFEKAPQAVAVYPDWVDIGSSSEFLRAIRLPDYDIRSMLTTFSWGLGPGTFFRRGLLDQLGGGRNASRVYCGDMEFWARAAMYGQLIHIPRALATHRTHDGSASVSQRGAKLANEWIDTWKLLLNCPQLPPDLVAQKSSLLGRAYLLSAKYYCGTDWRAATRLHAEGRVRLLTASVVRSVRCVPPVTPWLFRRLILPLRKIAANPTLRKVAIGLVRWKYQLSPASNAGLPSMCQRFAICTRFTPPLWSGQAVVLGRLLGGISPDNYCMVSLPLYPDKEDRVDYTAQLLGRRYLLPTERSLLGSSLVPDSAKETWRQIGLLYQAWQRGRNIALALRDDSADTIVGCSGDLLDLPAAWIASKLLGRRFVVHFFDDYTEQWWADPLLRSFASRIERRVVGGAAKILVTNEYMQAEILRRHGRQSNIIRNPCQPGTPSAPLERFPAEPGEVRVVFTGAVYHLNYDILRAVTAALAMIEGTKHRLHIYTAQAREQLEAEGLTGPHVEIHGHVKPEQAAELQRTADILLIPFSFREDAKGIIRTAATAKLADYLAAGRPVLALCQENSFLAWFLRERDCGLAVSSDDPADIATTIRLIGEDQELRRRMQINAGRVVAEEFDPVKAMTRLLGALDVITLPAYLRIRAPQAHPEQLKVVQVSALDLVGIQVNGFLTHKWLQAQGHDSKMLVYSRMSGDPCVRELGSPRRRILNPLFVKAEAKLNSWAMLPILSRHMDTDPWVREADVVNLQLIHGAPFFSLLDLPRLTRNKRVVLSVHDMFLMTGHCIYPMACERWKSGCGACPDLGLPFQMSRDTSSRNWKLKRWAFDHSNLDIVVGSAWQEEHVSQSPLLSRFRRHMIPYGVDTRVFKPGDKKEARRRLGLPEDAHVIAFRSAPFHRNYKGTEHIQQALRLFRPRRPTVLMTFDTVGGLDDLRDKYQFHELGWVTDGEKIAEGLQAADIFLMPSTAEAFGLMAIESMACGTPPIVFDGTALPDTIGGPNCGAIVPQGDAVALAQAIEDCLDNPERLERYRHAGLNHATSKHGFDAYARGYLDLYQELVREKRN